MTSPTSTDTRFIILGIMVAVLVWGLILALGAFLTELNLVKAGIVAGCVLVFLVSWLLALALRARRQRKNKQSL